MANPAELSVATVALRLGAGALFGAAIGVEREFDGHDAGLRTHVLLALGSALFGTLSVGAFGAFVAHRNDTNITIDPTRIASYVIAGVGFLGAGAIIKRDDRIKGLTTAGSLWVVSAVGLAAGLGFWSGAVIASLMAAAALLLDRPLRKLTRRIPKAEAEVDAKPLQQTPEGNGDGRS